MKTTLMTLRRRIVSAADTLSPCLWIGTAMVLATLTLTACGSDDGGDAAVNPAHAAPAKLDCAP
ncbi:hypothetical protein [Burkholderia sp. A1]|uniref:hypothetical protein n=1 Tax=Burkholderia sp. A1 TaxID=148446 RepID=UPI000468A4CE|nr:hypothetical protein [Burkholderia sp. A1]